MNKLLEMNNKTKKMKIVTHLHYIKMYNERNRVAKELVVENYKNYMEYQRSEEEETKYQKK